jgi:transcriptional regulator GlxA family with amidase domain
MSKARDFVAALARAGKSYREIKKMVDAEFGDQTLKQTAIYAIIKKVKDGKTTEDQRHLNAKKTKRTDDLINAVAADNENERRVSIKTLAATHDVSADTIHRILHQDLGLE